MHEREHKMPNDNSQVDFSQNAANLQNLQNQKRAEGSTVVEWIYWVYANGKSFKNIYELSKVVSPQQTVRQVAKYTIRPLTKFVDYVFGLEDYRINIGDLEIPCSFTAAGNVVTEGLSVISSPAQWLAYKLVDSVASSAADNIIETGGLQHPELRAFIKIGTSSFCQNALSEGEKSQHVQSLYKTVDSKLSGISQPINAFVDKQTDKIDAHITKGLGKIGIDAEKPLGLTAADIDREKRLVSSEERVADAEDDLELLKQQQEEQQKQLGNAKKDKENLESEAEKIKEIDSKKIVKKARKDEKNRHREKHKHDESKKKVLAKNVAEQLSDDKQQQKEIYDELVHKMDGKHGKKRDKAMKKVIKSHKHELSKETKTKVKGAQATIENSQQALKDNELAKNKTNNKLEITKQENSLAQDEFDKNTNQHQKNKHEKDKENRRKQREARKKNSNANRPCYSGNTQLTLSLQELEDFINQNIKDIGKMNIKGEDSDVDLSINGRVTLIPDANGNLQIKIPVKIHVNQGFRGDGIIGNCTDSKAELTFDVRLSDSSPEQVIGVNINHASGKITNKPRYVFCSVLNVASIKGKTNAALQDALHDTKNTSEMQKKVDSYLQKDNVLKYLNEKIPENLILKPGAFNVRPRMKDGHPVYDLDINGNYQYNCSADEMGGKFEGFSLLGRDFDEIKSISTSNGVLTVEFGSANGSIIVSCKPTYLPQEQRFIVTDVTLDGKTDSFFLNNLHLIQNTTIVQENLAAHLNSTFDGIRSSTINNLQQQTPMGQVNVDTDAIRVDGVTFDNNGISVTGSVQSYNTVPPTSPSPTTNTTAAASDNRYGLFNYSKKNEAVNTPKQNKVQQDNLRTSQPTTKQHVSPF